MSPELQQLLNDILKQIEQMSDEECENQIELLNKYSVGPTAEELIKSFHEPVYHYMFNETNNSYNTEQEQPFYIPEESDNYSLAA